MFVFADLTTTDRWIGIVAGMVAILVTISGVGYKAIRAAQKAAVAAYANSQQQAQTQAALARLETQIKPNGKSIEAGTEDHSLRDVVDQLKLALDRNTAITLEAQSTGRSTQATVEDHVINDETEFRSVREEMQHMRGMLDARGDMVGLVVKALVPPTTPLPPPPPKEIT